MTIKMPSDQKVFLVHGRDEGFRDRVARFLEKLGLLVVILQERPNGGRTVIEKIEALSDVKCAVVLMTADDIGRLATDKSHQNRARQNVVFELGYFVGKLGRQKVCVLCQPEIEMPSDFAGVVYLRMDDAGLWKMSLAQELRAASIRVDLNRLCNLDERNTGRRSGGIGRLPRTAPNGG